MSNSNICSNDEKYGGFGAAMANSLHCWDCAAPARAVAVDSATPARAVAAVAASGAPGTKKSPPVTVAKHTWLTKRPYNKHQKKSHVPAPVLQAAAPTAAPAPVPLVAVDKAAARAPVEMKPPPVLPAALAVAPVPFSLDEPIHPSGILVKIIGTEMSCQGRSCEEHEICGEVLATLTRSSDAAAHNAIPSACIRFEAATRPRFLRAV
jgi:hypothetical protein